MSFAPREAIPAILDLLLGITLAKAAGPVNVSHDTALLTTRILPADATAIAEAAGVLARGGLAAFPTETVYGLGANAADPRAVAALYAAKGRPAFNPLIAHVRDIAGAKRFGMFDARADALAAAFWPGPLTLVLKAFENSPVSELARAGLETVAIRVPSHPVARALLALCDFPVVAPSANRSGHVSPTRAEHVASDLDGKVELVLDGGACPGGIESTIVDCSGETLRLLRTGGIPRAEIEKVAGLLAIASANTISAPGMMASHYAPRAKLRLDAREVRNGEALLAFGEALPAGAEHSVKTLNLSPRGDLTEAASNLYAQLRTLDATGALGIAVAPIPAEGLGEAIRDRLQRAAATK